jgi:hypothetical protein
MFPRMLQGCLSLQGTPDLVRAAGEWVGINFEVFAFSVACRVLVRSLPEADNI